MVHASNVNDFSSLHELMLLEDFKKCLPERIVLYLNEQKVTEMSAAAVLADKFVLTILNSVTENTYSNYNVYIFTQAEAGLGQYRQKLQATGRAGGSINPHSHITIYSM